MEFHIVYGIYLLHTQNTWQVVERTIYAFDIHSRNAWNIRYTMASRANIVHLQGWIPVTVCFYLLGVVY